MCFNSNRPMIWEEKSKIGFQEGGHFGFPIGTILAIFHLHVNLLLHYKFQLNSLCGLRDVQNRFSRLRLCYWSNVCTDTKTHGRQKKVITIAHPEQSSCELKNPPPYTHTCCKDSRPCLTVSQYQLDAPVTQNTQ